MPLACATNPLFSCLPGLDDDVDFQLDQLFDEAEAAANVAGACMVLSLTHASGLSESSPCSRGGSG